MHRWRKVAGDTLLALYGGLAWLLCLVLGVAVGTVVGIPERPDGVVQGGDYGIGAAVPEILIATSALLVVAYGLFFVLLARRGRK